MESIILIGNADFSIDSISKVKFQDSTNAYFSTKMRYVVEYEDSHVFFDASNDVAQLL